jgi:small subunit ribosomal protein S20
MPNITSAKKALRQNERRRALNVKRKTKLKSAVKEFRKLTAAKSKDEAVKALSAVFKVADKVAKTDFIKKNKANRIKSRATHLFKKAFEEAK